MWREKTLKHKDTETLRNKQKRINLVLGFKMWHGKYGNINDKWIAMTCFARVAMTLNIESSTKKT